MDLLHSALLELKRSITPAALVLAFIGVFRCVSKGWVDNRYARKLESHKDSLRKETEQQLETHKAELAKLTAEHKTELDRIVYEHQIQFSHMHEKRAEIIAELYSALAVARDDIRAADWEQAPKVDFKKLSTEVLNAVSLYSKNRIYFSEDVCERLRDITDSIRAAGYAAFITNCSAPPDEFDKQEGIYFTQVRVIDKVLELLERDFRKLLGVSSEQGQENSNGH